MLKNLCRTIVYSHDNLKREEIGDSAFKLLKKYLLNPELWRGSHCVLNFVDPSFKNPDKFLRSDQEMSFILSFVPDVQDIGSVSLSLADLKNGLWLKLSHLTLFEDGQRIDFYGYSKAFKALRDLLIGDDFKICDLDLEFRVCSDENNSLVNYRQYKTFHLRDGKFGVH